MSTLPIQRTSSEDGYVHLFPELGSDISEAVCEHAVPTGALTEPQGEPPCMLCFLRHGDAVAERIRPPEMPPPGPDWLLTGVFSPLVHKPAAKARSLELVGPKTWRFGLAGRVVTFASCGRACWPDGKAEPWPEGRAVQALHECPDCFPLSRGPSMTINRRRNLINPASGNRAGTRGCLPRRLPPQGPVGDSRGVILDGSAPHVGRVDRAGTLPVRPTSHSRGRTA